MTAELALANPADPLAGLGSDPQGYELPPGPVNIQFSGGRSSAYMLWRILDYYDGQLPDRAVVLFQNTGAEHPATLDFVEQCSLWWSADIVWLELELADERPKWRHRVVDYESASRNHEPFEALIRARSFLPNQRTRFCTAELKIRTAERYLVRDLGWRRWTSVLGIRADETRRAMRLQSQPCGRTKYETGVWLPLAVNGADRAEVMRHWRHSDFDLSPEVGRYGNCMGCFHKSAADRAALWRDYPEAAEWWMRMETERKTQWHDRQSWLELRGDGAESDGSDAELEGFCEICGD